MNPKKAITNREMTETASLLREIRARQEVDPAALLAAQEAQRAAAAAAAAMAPPPMMEGQPVPMEDPNVAAGF